MQNTLMIIFTPLSSFVRDAYHTSDSVLSSNVTIFHITVAILDLPSVLLLDSGCTQGFGMLVCFKTAFAFTIIGQWGRYLALTWYPDSFWTTIIASGIIALGQPFCSMESANFLVFGSVIAREFLP